MFAKCATPQISGTREDQTGDLGEGWGLVLAFELMGYTHT